MQSKKATYITFGIIIAVLVMAAVFTYVRLSSSGALYSDSADISLIQGKDALYTDLNGEPFDLSAFKGKVLVVNAWASWCPFCVEELPAFGSLKSSFGDQIEVVAINRKESLPTVRAFIDHVGNPEGVIFLLDENDTFYRTIGGFAMPETVFYDKEGKMISHTRGSMTLEEMRSHVNEALKERE